MKTMMTIMKIMMKADNDDNEKMIMMMMLNNIRPIVRVFSIADTPSRTTTMVVRGRFASLVTSSGRIAMEVQLVSRETVVRKGNW